MSHPHPVAHHPPRQNYAPPGVSPLPQQQSQAPHHPHRPRQSSPMSTIESTVTRLLVATKQLLESLTQWARGDTSEHEVSDVYVVLGNEFNVACRAFVAAGVDVADLGDVPQALRVILEKALSEDASEENLNKYLPQIREIIVNLLRQLKQKQTTIRANSTTPRPPIGQLPHSQPQAQQLQQPHQQPPPPQHPPRQYRNPSSESIERRQPFNDGRTPQAQQQRPPQLQVSTPQSPTLPPAQLSPSHSQASIQRPPSPSKSKDMNALAALQRGEALERRASRRFSAYQFAKLTNGTVPGTEEKVPDLPPLPSSASRTSLLSIRPATSSSQKDLSASISSAQTSPNLENSVATDSTTTPVAPASSTLSSELVLYLQIGRQVKKTIVQRSDIAISSLRLLFIDKFSYTPGAETFPDIYIQDPHFGVRYELDETTVEDVKEGSLLSLNVDAMDDVKKHIDEGLVGLQKTIEALNQKVEDNSAAIAQVSANAIVASATPKRDSKERLSSSSMRHSSSSATAQNREIESLRRELAVVRQVSSESMRGLRGQASQLIAKIQKMNLSSASSGSRGYMESCHKKLSGDTDHLLTSVDDLQDMIEAMRKDVAQRGVRADPKQLHYVSKEIVQARSSLEKMGVYITREKPGWKKIWEKELDIICEEQQFFKLQEELLADLADDLEKAEETFSLVEQASTEQHRALRQVQPVFDTVPIDGVVHAKDAVLSEVVALQPNHEQRVEAIQRAARLRKKELEMRQKDEFKEELGEFVAENKLKKSGGVEETERRRLIREQQMLEEQRKNDEEARLMREEERAKKREEKKKDKKKKKKEKKVDEVEGDGDGEGHGEGQEPIDEEEGDQTVLVHNIDENTRHSNDDLL